MQLISDDLVFFCMIMQIMPSDISGCYKILSPVSIGAWLQFLKSFFHPCLPPFALHGAGAATLKEKEEVVVLMLDP